MSDKGMTRSADETAAAFANLAAQSGMNFAQETASDYISREVAIAKIREEGVYGSGYSNEEREDNVVDMLASIPAADVRPVIKCKWKNLTRAGFASVEATCSACGKTLFYKSWWHFCPNCGAKVEKEQEDK